MDEKPKGYLQVRVSSSREAFPVEGAIVLVTEKDPVSGATGIVRSLRTDMSGLTEKIPLETKKASLSESPENESPFLSYAVEIIKDGYYRVLIDDVQVFEGISATLPVDLVPMSFDGEPMRIAAEERDTYER